MPTPVISRPSQTNRWVTAVVVLVIIAAGAGVLWWQLRPAASLLAQYFEFRVVDLTLTPEQQEQFRAEFESARADVEKNPDDFNAWMVMGSDKKGIGDYAGAAAIWEYAGSIRPNNSVSFNNLGDVYASFLHRPQDAVTAYRRAIINSLDEPKNEFYVRSLGDLQDFTLKDPTAALATFEDGLRRLPQSKQLLARAAEVAVQLGDRPKAIDYYTRLLALDPGSQAVKDELAKLRRSP